MDAQTLQQDILRAMRSWDAILRQQLSSGKRPADWRVKGFLYFCRLVARDSLVLRPTEEDFTLFREIPVFWGNYLEEIGAIKNFVAGEEIENAENDGYLVRIERVSDDNSLITLTIIRINESLDIKEFSAGQSLEYKRAHFRKEVGYDTWNPVDGSQPWFILSITADGRKTFEHYR